MNFSKLTLSLVLLVSGFQGHAAQMTVSQEGAVVHTSSPQKIQLINSGLASLKKRLDMIESAKKSIDIEFFIYNIDQTGRLFTQALIKKAREGVKVRMLVDSSFPVFQLNSYYATLLRENGIEVHYYNKSIFLQLFKMQFRSHRKLLEVDGEKFITGGRNIADEYFDLSTEYNFLDSDIYVEGDLAQGAHASFENFWKSSIVEAAPTEVDPNLNDMLVHPEYAGTVLMSEEDKRAYSDYMAKKYHYVKNMKEARDYINTSDKDRETLSLIESLGGSLLKQETSTICNDTTLVADHPGIGLSTRVTFKQLRNQLLNATQSVDLLSPYLVIKVAGANMIDHLSDKGVKVRILTNSLYSTDAFYSVSAFLPRVGLWIEKGVNVFEYDGTALEGDYISHQIGQNRWGIHSKAAVIDNKSVMVGTFNVDPRSKNLNAEMAVICKNNTELAQSLTGEMNRRLNHSVEINKLGFPKDGRDRYFNADLKTRLLYFLTLPFSNILDFLL